MTPNNCKFNLDLQKDMSATIFEVITELLQLRKLSHRDILRKYLCLYEGNITSPAALNIIINTAV